MSDSVTLWIVAHQAPCLWDSPGNIYFRLSINTVELLSLMAQAVINPPAMWETWVWSLGWEAPLEEGMATHSTILSWRIPVDRGAWQAIVHVVAKSQQLSAQHSTSIVYICQSQCPSSSHSSFPLLVSIWCSLFCSKFISTTFLDSTYKWCYSICFSFSHLLHST